jgi:hypothetical protein
VLALSARIRRHVSRELFLSTAMAIVRWRRAGRTRKIPPLCSVPEHPGESWRYRRSAANF